MSSPHRRGPGQRKEMVSLHLSNIYPRKNKMRIGPTPNKDETLTNGQGFKDGLLVGRQGLEPCPPD